eukprot:Lankesteria_metandrocarpae@DN10064_c0_g1_i1.p1
MAELPTSVLFQHAEQHIPHVTGRLVSVVCEVLGLLSTCEPPASHAEETISRFLLPLFCDSPLAKEFSGILSSLCDTILAPPPGSREDHVRGFPQKDDVTFRRLYKQTTEAVVYYHEKCHFLAAALSVLRYPETAAAAEILFQRSKTLLAEESCEFVDSLSESVCGAWFACPLIWSASKKIRQKIILTSAVGDCVAALTRCPDEGIYWVH